MYNYNGLKIPLDEKVTVQIEGAHDKDKNYN